MSDFTAIQEYAVESISQPIKYIIHKLVESGGISRMAKYAIYKLTEFIRVVDKFVFRQVPTSAASGYATIEQIEGNTVVFNQLCKHTLINWRAKNKLNYDSDTDIIAAKSTASGVLFQANELPPLTGHVFYVSLEYKASTSITFSCYSIPTANTAIYFGELSAVNSFKRVARIAKRSTSASPTENWALSMYKRQSDTGLEIKLGSIFLADLTAIFGAGNEPTTVADFEAWMEQNIGSANYYDYNAGELLSVKMSGMQTEDSSQQTLDTIALDVTTITGINTSTNVREVIFPTGMKQADYAGTVKDILDLRSDTATVNVGYVKFTGNEAWANGSAANVYRLSLPTKEVGKTEVFSTPYNYDPSPQTSIPNKCLGMGSSNNTVFIRDDNYTTLAQFTSYLATQYSNGTPVTLVYPLATPITYTDLQDANGNPLNPRYKVEQGGTEQVLPSNTSTPTTVAPTLTTSYTKNVH